MGCRKPARIGDDAVAGQLGTFPSRFQPDPQRRTRGQGHQAGPQQTLEVEHQIETATAKLAEQTQPDPPAAARIKENDFVQIRVTYQEIRPLAFDDPRDPSLGKTVPQGGQERQALHDVSEGTGLQDADRTRRHFGQPTTGNRTQSLHRHTWSPVQPANWARNRSISSGFRRQ